MAVTAARAVTVVSTVTEDFRKIHKEWMLGVKSMVYQSKKGRIGPGDLERFKRLEQKMEDVWAQVPPFDKAVFLSEKRRLV